MFSFFTYMNFILLVNKMFEFLFGFILGVWAGQALPLPSVGIYVQSYFVPKVENKNPEATVEDEEEEIPLFTGTMPPATSV